MKLVLCLCLPHLVVLSSLFGHGGARGGESRSLSPSGFASGGYAGMARHLFGERRAVRCGISVGFRLFGLCNVSLLGIQLLDPFSGGGGGEFEKPKRIGEMRNKASGFLKQILGAVAGLTKAKSLALMSKTNALKARVLLLSLLRNRRLAVESISHKLHSLLSPRKPGLCCGGGEGEDGEESAVVVVDAHGMACELARGELVQYGAAGDEEAAKYPDPRQSMFDLEDFEDLGGLVIDLVKNLKQEGEDLVGDGPSPARPNPTRALRCTVNRVWAGQA